MNIKEMIEQRIKFYDIEKNGHLKTSEDFDLTLKELQWVLDLLNEQCCENCKHNLEECFKYTFYFKYDLHNITSDKLTYCSNFESK